MEKKYGEQGLVVIGVHSPEFDFEKERSRVEAAVKRYNKISPVFMDNDHGYWRSLGNRYWPTFYMVDKKGIVRRRDIFVTLPIYANLGFSPYKINGSLVFSL